MYETASNGLSNGASAFYYFSMYVIVIYSFYDHVALSLSLAQSSVLINFIRAKFQQEITFNDWLCHLDCIHLHSHRPPHKQDGSDPQIIHTPLTINLEIKV